MAKFTVKKHVAAPCEQVFALAADFPKAPERIRGITKLEMLTDGPIGVGTRFKETRVMFKREASEVMEVTAFEPPRRYVLGCENHGCRYRTELRFTPKDGGTDVEMDFDAQPISVFAKLMSFLMAPMVKSVMKEVDKDLEDIKAAAEGVPAA